MDGVKLYGVPSITLLLQNERLQCPSSDLVDPLWLHNSEPSFQGSRSLVNFENVGGGRTLFQLVEKEEKVDDDDDDYEACFHQQGKKRRLTTEQVQFLERNFEVENKLEPERKVQLAKELGLQPRQVAIWFQNRRARFKTKQIEKDYGELKASFDTLKAEYEDLLQENHKLKEEVNSLKSRLIPVEKEEENLLLDDKFCDGVNSKHNNSIEHMGLVSKNAGGSGNDSSKLALPLMVMCKQEDAKSDHDVLDSEHSSLVDQEPAAAADDSSHDHNSEFSQDEEDNINNNIMTLQQLLPKVEDDGGCCYNEAHESCCNFGFPVEDQPFCFWSY